MGYNIRHRPEKDRRRLGDPVGESADWCRLTDCGVTVSLSEDPNQASGDTPGKSGIKVKGARRHLQRGSGVDEQIMTGRRRRGTGWSSVQDRSRAWSPCTNNKKRDVLRS